MNVFQPGSNVTSDEAVRELFKDEDKEKILKIEK